MVKAVLQEQGKIDCKLEAIIHATENLAIRTEILEHQNSGLCTALVNKKK